MDAYMCQLRELSVYPGGIVVETEGGGYVRAVAWQELFSACLVEEADPYISLAWIASDKDRATLGIRRDEDMPDAAIALWPDEEAGLGIPYDGYAEAVRERYARLMAAWHAWAERRVSDDADTVRRSGIVFGPGLAPGRGQA